jgi:hypothetical protein
MLAIVIIAGGFALTLIAGALVLLRLGIGGDRSNGLLTTKAPTRTACATRAITGLYVRMPERTIQNQPGQGPR